MVTCWSLWDVAPSTESVYHFCLGFLLFEFVHSWASVNGIEPQSMAFLWTMCVSLSLHLTLNNSLSHTHTSVSVCTVSMCVSVCVTYRFSIHERAPLLSPTCKMLSSLLGSLNRWLDFLDAHQNPHLLKQQESFNGILRKISMTPVHYPLSSSLLHLYSSTSRVPILFRQLGLLYTIFDCPLFSYKTQGCRTGLHFHCTYSCAVNSLHYCTCSEKIDFYLVILRFKLCHELRA